MVQCLCCVQKQQRPQSPFRTDYHRHHLLPKSTHLQMLQELQMSARAQQHFVICSSVILSSHLSLSFSPLQLKGHHHHCLSDKGNWNLSALALTSQLRHHSLQQWSQNPLHLQHTESATAVRVQCTILYCRTVTNYPFMSDINTWSCKAASTAVHVPTALVFATLLMIIDLGFGIPFSRLTKCLQFAISSREYMPESTPETQQLQKSDFGTIYIIKLVIQALLDHSKVVISPWWTWYKSIC